MEYYINEFRPLAESAAGRQAIAQHKLPPFIDGSCRREPDLESPFPSITALCRGEHFAPRLKVGDMVAYMTKDFAYPPKTDNTRRLVAILQIEKTWRSHRDAASWYNEQNLPLPRNCMVAGSEPLPLDFTDRYRNDPRGWELHYWRIARTEGVFHACRKVFCELIEPPRLKNQQLANWFGGTLPDTRNFPPVPPHVFMKLLRWLKGSGCERCLP